MIKREANNQYLGLTFIINQNSITTTSLVNYIKDTENEIYIIKCLSHLVNFDNEEQKKRLFPDFKER